MIRRRIAILFVPTLLIIALAAVFGWLLHTEPGARWILQRVAAAVPGQLQFQRLDGNLQSGLRIRSLTYRDDALSVEAERLMLQLDLDFWPPALSIHRLETEQLSLSSRVNPEVARGEKPADWLSRLSLPLPVELQQVTAGRLSWFDEASEPLLDLRELAFSADWYRSLRLRDLRVMSGESHLTAHLAIDFAAPHEFELTARGSVAAPEKWGAGQAPLELNLSATGDLGQSRWEAQIADPPLEASAELKDLLGTPAWDMRLVAGRVAWPPAASDPSLILDGITIASYGTATDYGLEAQANTQIQGLPAMTARLVGTGDLSGMDIQLLDLTGDAAQLNGSGRLDWKPALAARGTVEIGRFDPAVWLPAWGDANPLHGRLELAWVDQRVEVTYLDFEAPGTLAVLRGSGHVDLATGTVASDLTWQGFAWPPGAAEPTVVSREGRALLGGRLEAWTISGQLDLNGPDVPAGRLQVRGGGNRESMHLQVPDGSVLGGSLAGAFDVSWSPEVSWAAVARVTNVTTAPLAPAFPGRISGELAVRGRPEPPLLDVDIRNLSGVVRERQVQVHGGLALEDGRVQARNLQIRSGHSRVTLDGHQDSPRGLTFAAQVESLSDLLEGVAGSFEGSGSISMDRERPLLILDAEGRDLSWEDYAVAELSIATEPTADSSPIRLQLSGIGLGESRIENVTAVADGARPLDRLVMNAQFADSEVQLSMNGRIQDWSALLESGWKGRVESLRLEGQGVGFIELEEPVALQLNETAFALEPACFRGSREGRLCLETTWRHRGERALEASLEEVSPNLAMKLLDSELLFSQRISGHMEWRQQPGSKAAARVNLQISAGEIMAQGEDEPILKTGVGRFGFELSDGRLYGGNLDIPVPGAGGIDTDFSVPDVSAGVQSPAQGRIRINLNNIEPFLRLLPGLEGSSGPVTADLNFSGTVDDPQLTGHASLVRGRISHFASGLLLEDIRLAGAVYRFDQTELNGTFRAGSGRGSIRAVLDFDNILEPQLLLQINGENLTVVDVPNLNVTADPDVRLIWREGELNLAGRVAVPAAQLSPLYLPTSAAVESRDLVIVAGEDPLAEQASAKPVDRRLRGTLELELGPRVQLLLDRAKAQLQGNARFNWDGQLVPIADGGFTVSGEILAYGQLLKVTEGRVNFSNRPADNPFLNIRAEREIYGNLQVRRAGVLVTGTLKQPVLEPYSVPMTTRERALTLLVTGSDFNYEEGVGSVEVGMYVAPKLFISYGIGLFEDQNVISARYDLGRGFGVKTTSGQRETGADISYTIER